MIGRLDPEIERFITNYVPTFLAWDILIYFNDHPEQHCVIDVLADSIGREIGEVRKTVEYLALQGILNYDHMVYTLTPDPDTRHRLARFARGIEVRETRFKVMSAILLKTAGGTTAHDQSSISSL